MFNMFNNKIDLEQNHNVYAMLQYRRESNRILEVLLENKSYIHMHDGKLLLGDYINLCKEAKYCHSYMQPMHEEKEFEQFFTFQLAAFLLKYAKVVVNQL